MTYDRIRNMSREEYAAYLRYKEAMDDLNHFDRILFGIRAACMGIFVFAVLVLGLIAIGKLWGNA